MKSKKLLEEIIKFQEKLIAHKKSWGSSLHDTMPDYPIRNRKELEEQCRERGRLLGKLRPQLEQFRNSWLMENKAAKVIWNALDSAVGLNDVAQIKGPSLRSVIDALDQIIGRLQGINSEDGKVKNMDNSYSWITINKEFGITKKEFGRKINFVKDKFCRKVIFRDVEQAYVLEKNGFSKPSVVLAGGVIEELLRQYLKHKKVKPKKNTFDEYIKTCQNNGILKVPIHNLSNYVKYFRNIVHIEKEKSNKDTITKAIAKGIVSSIFTIANDF